MIAARKLREKAILLIPLACLLAISINCAYFNVFYNARKSYNEGLRALEKSNANKPSAEVSGHFNKAITKASKVIEDYPKSKWCDDALLLIGKSYYYQGKYREAQVTFQEMITKFSNSPLIPPARLFYAKTLLKENKLGLAEAEFQKITGSDIDDKIKSEAYFGLADLLYYQKDYNGAIDQYNNLIASIKDNRIKAQAQLQVAECYRAMENYQKASEEFSKVEDFDPGDNVKYLAGFGYGISLEQMGEYDKAITAFSDLLSNRKYFDSYSELLIEIARCNELKGDVDEAITILEKLNRTDVSRLDASQDLSLLFTEDVLTNKQAQQQANVGGGDVVEKAGENRNVMMQEAANTRQPASQYRGNPEALYYIGELQLMKQHDLVKAKNTYSKALGAKPEKELRDNINGRLKVINELQMIQRNLNQPAPVKPRMKGEPEPEAADKKESDKNKDKRRGLVSRGADGKPVRMLAQQNPQGNKNVYSDSLKYKEALKKYNESLKAYQNKKALNLYRIAELYMTEFDNPDSAVAYLNRIVQDIPDDSTAAKALYYKYTIATEHSMGNVDQIKQTLVTAYPSSPYAVLFTGQSFAEIKKETPEKPALVDSAEVCYLSAEASFNEQIDYVKSIERFLSVSIKFPESEYAAKALFAAGWIYEYKIGDNEKAIDTYKQLIAKYPQSSYANSVKGKIKEVEKSRENEERIKNLEEKREKILNQQPPPEKAKASLPDSTAVKGVTKKPNRILKQNVTRNIEQKAANPPGKAALQQDVKAKEKMITQPPDTLIDNKLLKTLLGDSLKTKTDSLKKAIPDTIKAKKKKIKKKGKGVM